jgi:hypothetical protein
MASLVVSFEMGLQKAQGINSSAAALTERGALFGVPYRHFFKHGRKQ